MKGLIGGCCGLLVLALLAKPAEATDYYVSPTGSNSNSGTSLSGAFLTIQAAASMAQAGDNVYVRGGTYRETVTVANSGTAVAPITFQPYNNEQVTITGLDVLGSSGWTTYSGSTYQKTIGGGVSQLFVNGQMMTEARSANSGYVNPLRRAYNSVDSSTMQTFPAASTITSASLGNPANDTWNGATMAMLSGGEWVTMKQTIANQTGNTISFQWPTGYSQNTSSYGLRTGNRFYLYGSRAAVDSAKEYYYDAANSKLYFNSSVNPNTQTVEARKRELGFDLGAQSYVSISGFSLKAANVNVAGDHNTINNCQVLYPTAFTDSNPGWQHTSGVTISGQYNALVNSEVAYSWGSGVSVSGSNNAIVNNLVHDVDWYANDSVAIDISGTNGNTVTSNTMYNTGRSGLSHRLAGSATITHNEIARFGFLANDLGGTSCVDTDGSGTVIAYNKIHDSYAISTGGVSITDPGVYLDNYSSNITVHHNLVYNAGYGVGRNATTNGDVYNNTFWNIGHYATFGGSLTDCDTYNNLSNKGTFIGTSTGTNITTTTDQFVNSAAGDYTLKSGSVAINAGTVIPGITDGYVPSAPDVGAFEYGATPWTAGASFKTWLFGNQTVAPLSDAVSVTSGGVRTTTGPLVAGKTGSYTNNRSFLKFDLSSTPNGPTGRAILRLYENTAPTTTDGVSLYAVASSWNSGSVSYNQSVAATGTAFYDPNNLDWYTEIDITSLVSGWIDNPSMNYGVSLRSDAEGTSNSAKYFDGLYGVTLPQLIITAAQPDLHWNGTGTWSLANTNWATSVGGSYNQSWASRSDAVFEGTAGTVTISEPVTAHIMEFNVSGYTLSGGANAITLLQTSTAPTLTVGTGNAATINAFLAGTTGFTKSGGGTLTWSANNNTITGPIAVDGGALVLSGAGTFDQGIFNSTTPRTFNVNSGGTLTLSGAFAIGGNGSVVVNGGTVNTENAGGFLYLNTLQFTGSAGTVSGSYGFRTGYFANVNNQWSVDASASGSTISVPVQLVKGTGGSYTGTVLTIQVANGAAAQDFTISGAISDLTGFAGLNVSKLGAGVLTLTGTNSYTGQTIVSGGTLQIGAGGTTGSVTGGIVNNAALVFNRSDAYAHAGNISGTGTLTKLGTGTTNLTGTTSYTGATTVQVGALELGVNARTPVLSGVGGADIQGGKMVLDYTGTADNPAATIASLLDAGYDVGWATGQIINSIAGTTGLTLGWKDDAVSQVTVMATLSGDADLNGSVTGADLSLLLSKYNQAGNWAVGDFNYDGSVTGADLSLLLSKYNQSIPASVAGAPVPEPGTVVLLGMAALGVWACAWRRRSQPLCKAISMVKLSGFSV